MCKRISINVCSETPFSKNPHHIKPTYTQPTPILLCDCLKELIQLFEENFPCPDDPVLDLNKQTQRTWKTVAASKSFLWVSLIQITYRYVNIFYLILRSFLIYKILAEVALEEKICKCFYWKNDGKCLRWGLFLVMMTEHVVQRN